MADNKLLWQGNAITHAKYELTSTQKNILYLIMSQLGAKDTPEQSYYLSVRDLEARTERKLQYEQVKDSIDGFMTKIIEIKKPNGNVLRTTFFSSAEYITGKGMIEISMDKKIRPYFFDLKNNFTTFQLEMALSLKSKYSKRLYEILSSKKDLFIWSIEIDELKSILRVINPKTGKDSYPKWTLFNNRIIKVAQKELANHTDINFTYTLEKRARKFHKITFDITHGSYQSKLDFKDAELQMFTKLKERFSLRKDQALKVIENNSEKDINKQLYKIALRKPRDIGAYTAKIFGV